MSNFATLAERRVELGLRLGDEIVLASVRKQRVTKAHGSTKAFPGVISARAWQATGRVD